MPPQMNFHSDEPTASDLHARYDDPLAAQIDRAMASPAFLNSRHPEHQRLVEGVRLGIEALAGTKPVPGGQPFPVMSFNTSQETKK